MTNTIKNDLPCVSFKTFFNFLMTMQSSMPARVDRSYWSIYLNGSNGKSVTNALLFLNFIDIHLVPTDNLSNFLNADPDGRINLMSKLIRDSYSKAFNGKLQLENITSDQLKELIKATYNLSKEDIDKCVLFLNNACKYANINVSNYLLRTARTRKSAQTKNVQKTDKNIENDSLNNSKFVQKSINADKNIEDKLPEFDSSWNDEIKTLWFTVYSELVKGHYSKING